MTSVDYLPRAKRSRRTAIVTVSLLVLAALASGFLLRSPAPAPVATLPEPTPDPFVPADPCGLDVVVCEGEEAVTIAPTPPTFNEEEWDIDPCVYSRVPCLPETNAALLEDDIEEKIRAAARAAYIDEDKAVLIARCESSLDPYAASKRSSAKGLYQFTDRTWAYIKAPGHQFDVDENIKQFMIWHAIHPEWWECE